MPRPSVLVNHMKEEEMTREVMDIYKQLEKFNTIKEINDSFGLSA